MAFSRPHGRGLVLTVVLMAATTAFGWGQGHETIARETLKRLPGVWGDRLRAGEGGRVFLESAHAPDDVKTLLSDRAMYLDERLRTRLLPTDGNMPVMYRFHGPDARCELVLAMSRAMRRTDAKALGFLLACFCHGVADTASANHSPLIQLRTYNWLSLGLEGSEADADCFMLDQTPERKAVFERASAKASQEAANASLEPQAVFDAVYADELTGTTFFRYDRALCAGGDAAVEAMALEASFAVRRTVEALLAAESYSRLPTEPTFDRALTARRFSERATAFLSARPMRDDAIVEGLLPENGRMPKVGVLYDPTGYWARGIVHMANRVLAVQIATTLKKRHDVALLDLRDVLAKGIAPVVEAVVAPCSGLADYLGFKAKSVETALAQFVGRGGRLVWVGGSPKPPAELFPETVPFPRNTARMPWGWMRGPVAADEMRGGSLIVSGGRFPCVREPRGKAGWYWGQLSLDFLPSDPLPEGCREIVRFETRDGRRIVAGYARGRRAFVPAFSVFPFLFTSAKPSVEPLVLELDVAGEAVLSAALAAAGFGSGPECEGSAERFCRANAR